MSHPSQKKSPRLTSDTTPEELGSPTTGYRDSSSSAANSASIQDGYAAPNPDLSSSESDQRGYDYAEAKMRLKGRQVDKDWKIKSGPHKGQTKGDVMADTLFGKDKNKLKGIDWLKAHAPSNQGSQMRAKNAVAQHKERQRIQRDDTAAADKRFKARGNSITAHGGAAPTAWKKEGDQKEIVGGAGFAHDTGSPPPVSGNTNRKPNRINGAGAANIISNLPPKRDTRPDKALP